MRALRSFRRTALLLFPLLLLSACGGGGGDGKGQRRGGGAAARGGTAIFDVLGDFAQFNPVVNTHQTTREVELFMLFTPLIQFDQQLHPQPYLAERWELSDSAVVFHLRRDVKWHDGQPVTAEDVKFTFDLAKNPESGSGLVGPVYLGQVDSATVIDPYTIRFHFKAPHADALEDFWWAPVPKHLLGNVPPAQLTQTPFNRRPVGSGPFKFVEWRPGNSLTLEANPAFPQALGGRPALDRVVFRVIPEATTLVTELLNGTADVIAYSLLPDEAARVKAAEGQGFVLSHYPGREFYYIGWNNTRPPFDDARVRRALSMAIDKPKMVEGLLHGFGVPAHGVIPPYSPMYTDLAAEDRYDVNAARQLLAEAGWRDTNGDGILEKNGRPLRFVLLTNSENRLKQDVQGFVQSQLRAVGADAQLRTVEIQTMLSQHKSRDYDAIVTNWTLDTFRVDPVGLFACSESRRTGTANRAGYCNPRVDELMRRGVTGGDTAQTRATWAEFSRVLLQDRPMTTLFWTEDMAGVSPRLQNAQMDPRSKLVNVSRWTKGR
jgi:peptide/nickel transport system substrate-binding protein